MFIYLFYIPADTDYIVSTERVSYSNPLSELLVDAEIFLRADRIGLENNETFTLSLEADPGSAAESFLGSVTTLPNTFVFLTIEVTIMDADGKPIT